MSAILQQSDVPRENLFRIGIISKETTRDLFHINAPRKPFVVSRKEALNIIGYLVTHADFTVADIEKSINEYHTGLNLFFVQGDERRVMISPPTEVRIFPNAMNEFERDGLATAAAIGLFLFTMEEAKVLCASLVHTMQLRPKELEAGVVAIFEHSRNASGFGESLEDMLKHKEKDPSS